MKTEMFRLLSVMVWCLELAGAVPLPLPMPAPVGNQQSAISNQQSSLEWEVHFSPRGGCTDMVVAEIDAACKSIEVQAYSFTSRPIAQALVRAHARGVAVEIVLDQGQRTAKGSVGQTCSESGIEVKFDAKHAIAHNKVIVIDGREVITGSFNFTGNAESSNAENCLLLRGDPELVKRYEENFILHRDHSQKWGLE